MTEREYLTELIAALEAARAALMKTERPLHELFMETESGSDEAREADRALDRLSASLDAIGDAVGLAQSRLYEIEAATSRREKIANAAYGRNP